MEIETVNAALKEALDTLDNYEALNRLTDRQLVAWELARAHLLGAMGAAVVVEFAH